MIDFYSIGIDLNQKGAICEIVRECTEGLHNANKNSIFSFLTFSCHCIKRTLATTLFFNQLIFDLTTLFKTSYADTTNEGNKKKFSL